MPDENEEMVGSQTDENQDTNEDDVMSLFGIQKESTEEEPPAKEEESKDDSKEKKTIKVKVDKEEREFDISDDKLPEYVQKAYALDRERERKSELEKNLDRAARLAGFENHADFIANLDKLEKAQEQQKQTELDQLKNDMLDNLEIAGYDREKAEQWIENHPLFLEGKKAIEDRQRATKQADEAGRWQPLYDAYPELAEAVQKANGGPVDWYTPELHALIERGNDPLLAYEFLNKDKIKQTTKKTTEQRVLKEQQLGLRSKVETDAAPSNEKHVPDALANAFSAFGLPVDAAKKYVK